MLMQFFSFFTLDPSTFGLDKNTKRVHIIVIEAADRCVCELLHAGRKLTRPSTDIVLRTGDTRGFLEGDGGGRAAGNEKYTKLNVF